MTSSAAPATSQMATRRKPLRFKGARADDAWRVDAEWRPATTINPLFWVGRLAFPGMTSLLL
jgi:hypothetical protein